MVRAHTWLALLAALAGLVAPARGYHDFSDLLPGDYCSQRGCCDNRLDSCSVPIVGTLCYCDDFCNATSDDCCPDYLSHCRGISVSQPLQRGCYLNNQYYPHGSLIKINCNECKCQASGALPEFLCERHACLVEPDTLVSVNSQQRRLGWSAANHTAFWGRRLDEGISLRLGTLFPHNSVRMMNPVRRMFDASRLPRSFDARSQWRGQLQGVSDQGWCGASWALSMADVVSDRFAIMSEGKELVRLSAQQLLSCSRGQRGCEGGYLDRAWMFLWKYGLVNEECYPYGARGSNLGNCRLPKKVDLHSSCRHAGPRGPHVPERRTPYHTGPAYRISGEKDIMHEIMVSGPVQATMKVYQDFFSYRAGVYQNSHVDDGQRTGYHSVRILGWGEETLDSGELVKYWLAANSWGPLWGEGGYFRIRRGNNECEVEDFVLAAWAHTYDSLQGLYHPRQGNRLY
ncbi:uncharacterized peptidase C1-like protein F26E4.3 [Bacillus rossius redtenbacheri]|uniref:uncharacterized peptidase C1-like protein F26E4.3 n=1 Tax=Bacillus rossius redtenbacheri TaxID=93214 RepID=UPI002FDE7D26